MGRRKRNFKDPSEESVVKSVDSLIDKARRRAANDHNNAFATRKERDLVATIYLRRSLHRLSEALEE